VWPDFSLCIALNILDLSNNQLTFLPAEIGRLVNLTILDISNNQLTALPAEMGLLAALQTLSITGNPIFCIPPVLAYLGLDGYADCAPTALPTAIPTELPTARPTAAPTVAFNATPAVCNETTTSLDLSNLGLTALPDLSLCTALTVLDLSNNQLTSLPAEIGHLIYLTALDISNNQLTTLPAEIGQLVDLIVHANNNPFNCLPRSVKRLPSFPYSWVSACSNHTVEAFVTSRTASKGTCEGFGKAASSILNSF
jgi:Leucine-rich repeat (LRR) protein